MKRRQFLKSTALFSASAALLPRFSRAGGIGEAAAYSKLEHLYLSDFDAEQDEGPILFGNGRQTWLTTLRRRDFPARQEIIPCFSLQGETWEEVNPVTAAGEYEAVAATCAEGGEPIVVWTELENQRWLIKAAIAENRKFQPALTLSHPAQRSINPVVKAASPHSFLVAWEVFERGQFSLYLSRFDEGRWSPPVLVAGQKASCFEPALEVARSGEIYLAYSCTDGVHRNVHLAILDPRSLQTTRTVPVAVGGGLPDRVNINAHPALAWDREQRLWISWENNRFTSRLEDSDSYTGDRCCAMVCYLNGRLHEQQEVGRWLFQGKNDHLPTFFKDPEGHLFVLTHCGGGDSTTPFWSFRISHLDPARGWVPPATLVQTRQKGESQRPSIAFAADGRSFWMIWKSDLTKNLCTCCPGPHATEAPADLVHSRRGRLELERFAAPDLTAAPAPLNLVATVVTEHHPVENFRPLISGRRRQPRPTITCRGETYTLLRGNLHEHSENSNCWPAGTDGTLHDDFRYGLYSEGYDFAGITDHSYSLTEIYWRKSLRLAEFYNDPAYFVALPSTEWTLSNQGHPEIRRGVGHRNIFFADIHEARKFVRNKDEVYSETNPEARDAEKLWALIRKADIDCIAIPHHPADETHPCCWETRDEEIEPVVEIFQCRGNAEYRGAPRMINVSRHKPLSTSDKGFIDYALRDKQYRLGFVASGDHNSLGVGLACLWVKEV
ncbi:MAG: DUF3604 domain-containing protein, partial [Verrucomicrobia bacterium]|nr:DUF3604 domain-containing protein [Verrucomicrobiota bacterium]